MRLKKIFFCFLLMSITMGIAQEKELSPNSKISLLTVGTANELHSQFGHTAIRIQDFNTAMDIVFGYGGFDFNDPLFYSKFTTGKLDYSMTGHRYNSFLKSYKIENRWVYEQELNLTLKQRNALFKFLQNNYKEENRLYKYDFLFDNCATKIPEVFNEVFTNHITFDFSHLEKKSTFRQLIHETLQTNSWATFGIDLALGAVIDREATPAEHQFLPLYVKKQFENIKIDDTNLVSKEQLVLENKPQEDTTSFFLKPLFWLLSFSVFVLFITYLNFKNNCRSRGLDFLLFLITGLTGILIFFLWFGTNHSSTKMNFNILWAFPLNVWVAFVLLKKGAISKWVSKYLWFLIALLFLTLLFWLLKIQIFSPLLIPILIALTVRYLFLIHFIKHPQKKEDAQISPN